MTTDLILEYLSHKARQKALKGLLYGRGAISKSVKKCICDQYVSYATGWGYVLSRDLVQHIAEHSGTPVKFEN